MNFRTSEDILPVRPHLGTRFERGLDSLIGAFSPKLQMERIQARTKLHQYAGAETGLDRSPPRPLRNPDSPLAQSDALQMQRRAQDQGRDNAFIGYLTTQYKTYAFGDVQYIPNVGNRKSNQLYRDYWQEWMVNADVQGRFHFIDLLQLSLAGVIYNGRHGFIHHHGENGEFQLQSVMGYNIGNPRAIYTNPKLVSGLVIDNAGRVIAYDLYRLGLNGTVNFVGRYDASIFSILNPVQSTDEYSAKTPLHAILNDAHDMKRAENAWMKKIEWAAFKTAVFNTPNGSPPDGDPNDLDTWGSGNPAQGRIRHQMPGEEMHGPEGFSVEMLENKNPSNNETEFLVTKLAQIAMPLGLPLPFVWVMMGLPGTYTRLISEQAKRAFQHGPYGQKWYERSALNDIKRNVLISGIIRGEIPHEPNWNKGCFMYPAHPTVDVGRESKANIEENLHGLRSMASINSEEGSYWEDTDEQLAAEAENKMLLAQRTSERFNQLTGEKTTWRDAMPFIQSLSANPPNPAQTEQAEPESKEENK